MDKLIHLTDLNGGEVYVNMNAVTAVVKSQIVLNTGPDAVKEPCVIIYMGQLNNIKVKIEEWDRIRDMMTEKHEALEK